MASIYPENEFERLIELTELDLDYGNLKGQLSDLTKLAARIAGTEISLVNLIDSFTQWSVANQGIELQQMPREDSVCQYVVAYGQSVEIRDLRKDERFSEKSYVKGGPCLRYYYGVPLTTSSGLNIGALCLLDKESNDISPENQELLKLIANQVIRRLEAIKLIKTLEDKVNELTASKRKVSHDIRNPISGIIGLAEMMKENVEHAEMSEMVEVLETIQLGGESLLELTDSILNTEDGQLEGGENHFSCKTFAQKLKELYLPQAKVKQVNLEIQTYEENQDVPFLKNRLLQIVGNLVSNSIKFTPSGGTVRIVIFVEIKNHKSARNTLVIQVVDTGRGITESKKQEILSGNAVSEPGTSGEKGYGYGVSLVLHLINKANGSVDIQSEVDKGTRFEVRLPI